MYIYSIMEVLPVTGTSMEECFGDTENGDAVRKRVRIISVWNGKKVYLEEFYNILKTAIEGQNC